LSERHLKHWPRYVPRNITLPQTSLWVNAAVAALRYPDKPCLLFYDSAITYRDFTRDAERLAGFLQRECGVQRGDRVALYMHNSPQFIIAYYAILRADAVVVPVNPMLLCEELEKIVADSGARVAIAPQDLYAQLEPLLSRQLTHAVLACYADYLPRHSDPAPPEMVLAARQPLRGTGVMLWSEALACDLRPAAHRATPEDLCVLPYTSGTTGIPKGCMHTHRSVMHTTVTMSLWSRLNPDDRSLAALPLFHVTGMQNSMNVPVYLGGSMVVLPRWNRHAAAALIRRHRVTRFSAVPTMIVDLLSSPELEHYDLSSLVSTGGGGAAMPEAVAAKLQSRLGLTFLEGYGLSETIAPSHINPDQNPKRQCLGIPICNTDSRVVDPATLRELAPGETGEIVTHGPGVFEGYWNNPQATREAFVEIDGKRFLRTGDLGRTDEDGYFFFVDRIKRMINAAGFKVWPAEVESALYAHPAVHEAAVISSRDPRRGETVKAVIVLQAVARGHTQPEEIIDWARAHMAAYKVPRVIEFVDSLPKSMAGKILWRELQEREDRAGLAQAEDGK
jgi:fatty-acyl-CoA synthase